MKTQAKYLLLKDIKAANLALPLFEGERPEALITALDSGDRLRQAFECEEVSGKPGRIETVLLPEGAAVSRLICVGLGRREEYDLMRVRRVMQKLIAWSGERGLTRLDCLLFVNGDSPLPDAAVMQAQIVAAKTAGYRFNEFKSERKPHSLKTLALFTQTKASPAGLRRQLERGILFGDAVNLARDLINKPGNVVTPAYLAQVARRLRPGGIKVKVLDSTQLAAEKCGGILAVGQGSRQKPRLVVMEYKSSAKQAPTVALVGKGVTFDSGGISLKPGTGMHEMKGDMAGAAAVIGVCSVLARLKPSVNVIGVVPAAENMPSGAGYKPGDIIRCHSGKTVEILNTDAEGRLLLADGISWVERKYRPAAIIDVATLTGAVVMALGHEFSGLLSNDDQLAEQILDSGAQEGDPAWRLPLTPAFEKLVESNVADLRNSVPNRAAGTITAGAFLKAHVRDTAWAHLDIAGTSWPKRNGKADGPQGAAVRLLLNLLENFQPPIS